MHWASTVSRRDDLDDAVLEACGAIQAELGGERPDLAIAFVSQQHAASYERVPSLVRTHLPHGLLIGCSAGGVIGGGREVEEAPGFSLTAARLPDVAVTPLSG